MPAQTGERRQPQGLEEARTFAGNFPLEGTRSPGILDIHIQLTKSILLLSQGYLSFLGLMKQYISIVSPTSA